MSYGLLLLRLVVGLSLAAHGAQKLFGAFGGGGLRGTARLFADLGLRNPLLMALMAGTAEFGGGLLIATGLLTPLGGLALAAAMYTAIWTVHRSRGFWNTNGGYEYNLLVVAVVGALAATGSGRFSLDALIGWQDAVTGAWWGLVVLAGGAVASAATLLLGRAPRAPQDEPAADEQDLRQVA